MRITEACPLLLGSASPRRRELLERAGVPLVVRAVHVDESAAGAVESVRAYLERVTASKLDAVRALRIDCVACVLVADTIVVAPDGSILGKPADAHDARAMIARLAGRTHEVHTRFAIGGARAGDETTARTVVSRVTLRAMTRGEIDAYVASGEGTDKAGAYAVQGRAAAFVERIEGSYTNVVGLPLSEVVESLRASGWIE